MTYQEYQYECAKWGHIDSPLTWKEFEWLVSNGFDYSEILAISDDVAGGYEIAESIQALKRSQEF
jgi:hypothetical protein